MVAPVKGIMASSYELALFNNFLRTLDFSPSPWLPPWPRPMSEQSPSWSGLWDWFMLSKRIPVTLPTVRFTPMSTRRRLVCLVRSAALSWSGITQSSYTEHYQGSSQRHWNCVDGHKHRLQLSFRFLYYVSRFGLKCRGTPYTLPFHRPFAGHTKKKHWHSHLYTI